MTVQSMEVDPRRAAEQRASDEVCVAGATI